MDRASSHVTGSADSWTPQVADRRFDHAALLVCRRRVRGTRASLAVVEALRYVHRWLMIQPTCPMNRVGLMCSPIIELMSPSFVPPDGSGPSVRVMVSGEVDVASAGELERRLRCVIAGSSCRTIVLDLGDVEFLAACGVSVLLAIKQAAERAGRDLRVTNARGSPAKVLTLLGFESWCERAEVGEDDR
jgi:anti-sigma B factor antagonist